MTQSDFLATTALESFWLKDRHIIFLGPWCLRYSKMQKWNSLSYEVLDHPWQNRRFLHKAGEYCNNIYEALLPLLSKSFNEIHRENHNNRYWRIIIGPWVFNYIQIFYERYSCLKYAFEKHLNLETICLSEESYIVPKDYRHFMSLIEKDSYNLQLYSQILNFWGYSFSSKHLPNRNMFSIPKNKVDIRNVLKKLVSNIWIYLDMLYSRHAAVFLADMYFPFFSNVWKLCLRTRFSAWPTSKVNTESIDVVTQNALRKRLIEQLISKLKFADEFSIFLIKSLYWNFPLMYLEGYPYISAFINKIYGDSRPRAIFSSVGWHFDEPFKILAAKKAEKGAKLIGIQHGGGYGIRLNHPPEKHELSICDVFYSWGWKNPCNPKIRSLPNPKVCSFKKPKKERKTILYIGTSFPRYLYRIMSSPVSPYFVEYLEWREKFLGLLPNNCFDHLLIRLHPQDYGWDQKKRLTDKFPQIKVDSHRKSLFERLTQSKLVVCDNPQSTWLQVLAFNVPCILFWNPELWEVRDKCATYIDRLHKADILFFSPEKAARKLQEVCNAPEDWWKRRETQEARLTFLKDFVQIRSNWLNIWIHELGIIAREEMC